MPDLWPHWFRTCSESHIVCRTLGKKPFFSPDRLIEILPNDNDKNIINWRMMVREDQDDHVPYLTLSHCWGSSSHIQLTKTTYSAFLTGSQACNLPKTYQHAFDISLSLGFRYLWIDSLCIIQDSLEDWRTQSAMMGQIYSTACCNIAATWASDSSQGCFSKRDPFLITPTTIASNPQSSQSAEYQISFGYNKYVQDVTKAPLNGRGWVVQERCLAQKQLNFTKRQVYWECPELLASEEFPNGPPERSCWERGFGVPPFDTAKPSLNFDQEYELREAWCSLMQHYSACQLTRLSDKINAIAGLANEFRN